MEAVYRSIEIRSIANLVLLFRVFSADGRYFWGRTLFPFVETISFLAIFADISVSGISFFRLVETALLLNPSLQLVHVEFGLVSNHMLLLRGLLSLLVESIIEIRCKLIFFNFFNS